MLQCVRKTLMWPVTEDHSENISERMFFFLLQIIVTELKCNASNLHLNIGLKCVFVA